MKFLIDKLKSFLKYLKINPRRKLSFFTLAAAMVVLIACAAHESIGILGELKESEITSPQADLNTVNDGTENGVKVVKRKPAESIPETEKQTEEYFPQYDEEWDSASEYSAKLETDETVESILSSMSLEEKIYQMMFVTPEGLCGNSTVKTADEALKTSISSKPVGGVILFSDNLQTSEQAISLIDGMKKASKIPLFVGVDEEGGSVSRIGSNAALIGKKLPSAAEIGETGDESKAYAAGESAAENLKSLGFNLNFAPVADVPSVPDSQIGSRGFSADFATAGMLAASFTSALRENNIVSVLKHFPGIGSCTADTHEGNNRQLPTRRCRS